MIQGTGAALQGARRIAVLRGNLAPMARSSNRRRPRRTCCATRGAVVFESIEDLHARSTTRTSTSTSTAHGAQGVRPKVIPAWRSRQHAAAPKTTAAWHHDILRISDARMSGTAYGAVVLHVSPEAAAVARSLCATGT